MPANRYLIAATHKHMIRLFKVVVVLLLLPIWHQSALAQKMVVESETSEFIDYRLENFSLNRAPHYELLIPFARGDNSYRLLDVRYQIVEFESDTTDIFRSRQGSVASSLPLFETYNAGFFLKQAHAALKINITRPVAGNELSFQVLEQVRFRVYKSLPSADLPQTTNFANSSPLASGVWYKIPISRSGLHRLDRAYIANMTGLNVATLDPRRLQVWAGGYAMLPMRNSTARPEFRQIPIIVNGEADGRFDTDDSVIFYAEGPQRVFYNANTTRFIHETHLYSRFTYVFITVGAQNGQRFSPAQTGQPSELLTTYTDFIFKEEETNKIATEMRSGSEWLGERVTAESFGNTLTLMDSVITEFVANSNMLIDARLATRNRNNAQFETFFGTRSVGVIPFSGLGFDYNNEEGAFGYAQNQLVTVTGATLTNNRLQATSRFSSVTTADALGYLDYARLYIQRNLTAANGRLWIYAPNNLGQNTFSTYRLRGFTAAPVVLDVTNPQIPVQYAATSSGTNWDVVGPSSPGTRLVAASSFIAPAAASLVPNQNFRATASSPNYVIVVPDDPAFRPIAEELATFRQQNDGLRPIVVSQGQLFNEYSGGVPDVVAIRDFVRHLYIKAGSNRDLMPKYLLMFGNATHDYRGIYGTDISEKNLVITYQSRDSFHRLDSYGSDDFFGLLDENEGEWSQNSVTELVDIGIGRLPFNTVAEANVLLGKLKTYEDPSTFGDWRTLFTFAADDDFPEPFRNRDLHILNADSTAEFIDRDVSGVRLRKIYEINYPVETTSGARFRPLANRDFINSFNEGSLVVNYSGHGAEQTLSDSRLFQSSDISRLTNKDRLSIFVTATCSFGRFDDHLDQSGAEKTMLWPDGGIIAAFTTTRVVYTSENPNTVNFGLNRRLSGFMTERDQDGLPYRLGDIMMRTKNVTQNDLGGSFNTRKFILLGDPAMRIGLPRQRAAINRIQGQTVNSSQLVTLRALDTVSIEGSVINSDGSVNTSYNGEINVRVYDGVRVVQLPLREWMQTLPCYTRNCSFREQNDLLFNGRVSVRNGLYTANFVVPKDISYTKNRGRLLVYGQSGSNDAVGSMSSIVFNGINSAVQNDNRGPEMLVYLDSPDFVDGAMVGSNPKLIVELSDDTGINATGTGVGHELVAILNTTPEKTFVLNNFFKTNLDDYRSGRIEFPIDGLTEGEYSLTVRAWDVFNNPTDKIITFRVADSEDVMLSNVFNYPNPMNNRTRFMFEHNQPGNQLDISVRIYTLSGRPVAQIDESRVFPTSQGSVEWFGFDNDNDRLATGTYLYVIKVTAETSKGRRTKDVIEKLVIIR
jgi:hypothetical protein